MVRSLFISLTALAIALPAHAEPLDPGLAAAASIVPGFGYWLLGEPENTALTLAAMAVPVTLAALGTPPLIRSDVRGYYAPDIRKDILALDYQPFFSTTATKIHWVSMYTTYQEARARWGDRGYASPLTRRSVPDLVTAPFSAEHVQDWRVWAVVGAAFLQGLVLHWILEPATLQPTGPTVFQAREAELLGLRMSPAAGFAIDMAAAPVLAIQPALGEEALFRGIVQNEAERRLGQTPGMLATAGLVGILHLRDEPLNTQARRILSPTIAEIMLGWLYQTSGYDLAKPVAARFYYDALDFAFGAIRPFAGDTSVIGVRYAF